MIIAECLLPAIVVSALPVRRDEPNPPTEPGFYQSASAAAMVSLFALHQYASKIGFGISQKVLTTDAILGICIAAVSTSWTVAILVSGFYGPENPCTQGRDQCLAYAAYCPWILQVLSVFWLLAWLETMYFAEARELVNHPNVINAPEVAEKYDLTEASDKEHQAGFWKWRLDEEGGPYSWAYSVGMKFYLPVYLFMTGTILTTSIAAIRVEHYSTGLLNIAALLLYMLSGAGKHNPYGAAPHTFEEDMIRITCPPLSNSRYRGVRRAGLIYILPSLKHGFSAFWSVTLVGEEKDLAEVGLIYEDLLLDKTKEITRWRKSFRDYLDSFAYRVRFSSEDRLMNLAGWLLQEHEIVSKLPRPTCVADGDNLIQHDIIFTLCVAYRIVFLNRFRLWRKNRALYNKLFFFRTFNYNGVSQIWQDGKPESGRDYTKWEDLIHHVYRIFQVSVGSAASQPDKKHVSSPNPSPLFQRSFDDFEEYTEKLWEFCLEQQLETVYDALYLFATIWRAEAGICRPLLRPRNHCGDTVSWAIIWRQGWYQAGLTQLLALSPVVFSSFFSGGLVSM